METEDTAKQAIQGQAAKVSVTMLAAYAGGSTLLGIVFVAMYQWQMPFRNEMLLPVIPAILMGTYMAKQWNDFLFVDEFGVSIKPKLWIILLLALSLYLLTIPYAGANSLLALAYICCTFGMSNALIVKILAEKQDLRLNRMDDGRLCRRFTIMIPYAFFIAQYFLLGSSIALASTGPKCAMIVYGVYVIYLHIWWSTLLLSRAVVLAINAATILVSCGIVFIYFLFFPSGITGWLEPFFSNIAYTGMAVIAFAVFGCGIIAIPGLLELTQLHFSVTRNERNYNTRIRVIGIALIMVDACAYLIWILVPMSSLLLVGYTIGSLFWVVMARFRYGTRHITRYPWSWISAMICPVLLSAFFFLEFCGTWKEFSFTITFPVKESAFPAAGVTVISAVIEKLWGNPDRNEKSIKRKKHPTRLVECHIMGLVAVDIVAFALVLFGDNARACIALITISCNAFFTAIAQILIENGKNVCPEDIEHSDKTPKH